MRNWLDRLFSRYPLYARCAAVSLGIIAAALTALCLPDRLYTYRLTDGNVYQTIRTAQTDPSAVLEEAGRPLLENDQLQILTSGDETELQILRSQMVTVHLDGETIITECSGSTIGAVLEELDITLGETDYVRPSADTPMQEGMAITVVRVEHRELITEEIVPRETLTMLDLSLGAGETRVDDEGADGLARTTTYITYENGEVTDHRQTTEIVTMPRVRRISTGITHAALEGSTTLEVYQPPKPTAGSSGGSSSSGSSGSSSGSGGSSSSSSGTTTSGSSNATYGNASPVSSASGGILTTSSGETYSYTQVLACSATAYTTDGFAEKHNASGNIARVGTVAVDPKVIPLGTALYIVTDDGEYIYGYCIAEDTGGAVKGNIVDLFFNTLAECYAFGRRNCTVYVLG